MLSCSAAFVLDDQQGLRRGLAYSLICASAALTPSVVIGLLTKENARAPAHAAIFVQRDDLDGMWRVSGLCFN